MMEDDRKKTPHAADTGDGETDLPPGGAAGEDEGGSAASGRDGHLKDEQKPTDK